MFSEYWTWREYVSKKDIIAERLTSVNSGGIYSESDRNGVAGGPSSPSGSAGRAGRGGREASGTPSLSSTGPRSKGGNGARVTPSQVDGTGLAAVGLGVLLGQFASGGSVLRNDSHEAVGEVLDGSGESGVGGGGRIVGAGGDGRVELLEEGEGGRGDVQGAQSRPGRQSVVELLSNGKRAQVPWLHTTVDQ